MSSSTPAVRATGGRGTPVIALVSCALLLFLAVPGAARATLVTFDFVGEVTSVFREPFGLVAGVGDPVKGTVTFDPTVDELDVMPADPNFAVYVFAPPGPLSATIGTNAALTRPVRSVNVLNFDDADRIFVGTQAAEDFDIFQLGFAGPPTTFDSDSLQNFIDLDFRLPDYTGAVGFLQTGNPNSPAEVQQLIFDITEMNLRPVSEPATLGLLVFALGAVAFRRR